MTIQHPLLETINWTPAKSLIFASRERTWRVAGTGGINAAYPTPSALPRRLYAMQSFSDTLGQVYRAMMANKLRTFLTMFGIAWGVG